MSSKAGKVHFVIVKSAGYSNLRTDFKYFKKEFIKNDLQYVRIYLSVKNRVVQRPVKLICSSDQLTVFCMIRLFTGKISEQILTCYVLNIVNNCKKLFIFSRIFMFFSFFFTIYYMSHQTGGETLIFQINVKNVLGEGA